MGMGDRAHRGRSIPMREVPSRLEELERDRDVVASATTAAAACRWRCFSRKRLCKVHNLQGGVDAWSRTVDPAVPLY